MTMPVGLSVLRREGLTVEETPYGSVGVLHRGRELDAWWIWKEGDDIDPDWTTFSRDDFLFVVRGTLKLELRDGDDLVLATGDAYVIPAGTAFRGYRWPRDANEPCVFVAVSAADAATDKQRAT